MRHSPPLSPPPWASTTTFPARQDTLRNRNRLGASWENLSSNATVNVRPISDPVRFEDALTITQALPFRPQHQFSVPTRSGNIPDLFPQQSQQVPPSVPPPTAPLIDRQEKRQGLVPFLLPDVQQGKLILQSLDGPLTVAVGEVSYGFGVDVNEGGDVGGIVGNGKGIITEGYTDQKSIIEWREAHFRLGRKKPMQYQASCPKLLDILWWMDGIVLGSDGFGHDPRLVKL